MPTDPREFDHAEPAADVPSTTAELPPYSGAPLGERMVRMVPTAKPALGETVVEAVGTLAASAPISAVSHTSEVSPTVRENESFPISRCLRAKPSNPPQCSSLRWRSKSMSKGSL